MATTKTVRVTRYSLPLGKTRRLAIALRRFRTAKARRSKRIKQVVWPLAFLHFREVAIAVQRQRRVRRKKQTTRWLAITPGALIITGLFGAAYFALNLTQPARLTLVGKGTVSAAPVQPAYTSQPKVLSHSEPARLRIPMINLDTAIVPTDLNSDGTLAMPAGFDITGWYDKGPAPGDLGPAVIVGHVDQPHNIAVFWRLRELAPGDIVYVDRSDGSTATFKVDAIQQYPQDQFPTEAVYSNINHAGLRLITCGGVFNPASQHYSDNTVVYGSLQ